MAGPTLHTADSKVDQTTLPATDETDPKDQTVDRPDNVSEGDLIAFFWLVQLRNREEDVTAPSGVTFIGFAGDPDNRGRPSLTAWYKVAGSSEPSTYTFTTEADFSGFGNETATLVAMRVTGFNDSSIVHLFADASSLQNAVNSLTISSETTTVDNLLRITGFSAFEDTATLSIQESVTEVSSGGSPHAHVVAHDEVATSPASSISSELSASATARQAGLYVLIEPGEEVSPVVNVMLAMH